ncbi:MAG: aminotransferase class IV [Phycisphaerae bacterium]|nr:aminotransferase class IV [Phycisphaerae bacterium]
MALRVYLNGEIVDDDKAFISASDGGLLHSIGLFETVRVYGGVVFRLDEHIARMMRSAERLDLTLRQSADDIRQAAAAVIEANELRDGRMRITVTRGPVGVDAEDLRSTLLVTCAGEVGYPPAYYEKGMSVAIAAARVNPADLIAGHKTLNYWPRLLTLQAARQQHCGEALWLTIDNRLAEGCISNVFLVTDGRVRTPALDTPVLAGVTRAAVLECCEADDIPVAETALGRDDLNAAEEVFLTNSLMEVMPVVLVDRRTVGNGKPGQTTQRVAQLFHALVAKETAR